MQFARSVVEANKGETMNHNNRHRTGKVRFEANVTKEENELIIEAMKKTGVKTKRELLILLVERCIKGLD